MREFDVVVIGAGPGGYVAAIRAAQMGAKAAVIERNAIGGTCLNRGCIPTKALYYSAKAVKAAKHASEFGVNITGEITFDLARAIERKDGVVKKLVGGVEQLLKGNKVEVLRGDGYIEGPGKVRLTKADGVEVLIAKSIIIATGSEPAMIPAFNIDRKNVLTTTEMLELKKVPESLLIIGGGVNGCEFANLFATFGSSVVIVELLPTILTTEDRMVSKTILKRFKELGVSVLTEVTVDSVAVECDGRVKTTLRDGREFITEKVMVSIGRSLNSASLGLDEAGIKTEKGRIVVDERMETSVKGVYAIGDVTGKMLLAHVASAQGIIAAQNALGKDEKMDYSVIPAGIFTDPEIAGVGLREKDAEAKGIPVSVGRFPYAASGKALGMGETEGFVQILSDPGTDKVLGCSIVGAHATDLIGEIALAMKTGATVKDITETIHAHPTLPEIVMEAAEDVHGMAIHKIGRKR